MPSGAVAFAVARGRAPDPHDLRMTRLARTITVLPLVAVMYFNTSGGAYTTEGLIASVGPGLGLLILVLVPLLYSLPETLIVAELASAMPEEGGYYRWVRRAFGPFWGFQNGWLTWMYSLVDMAIYPALFNAYLAYFLPELGPLARWIVALAVIWGATAVNLRGAIDVGRASVVAACVIVGGFAALALAAIPHWSHVPWEPFHRAGTPVLGDVGVGLSIALWNYIGWDNASTVQGEVVDATRAYPRALSLALPLVMLGYLVPLGSALAASDWSAWREGGWPDIAVAAAGEALGRPIGIWIALGGLVSALALFNALLLVYSRIPLAMSADGLLPRWLDHTDGRGTPARAVLVSAVCYSIAALIPFGGLVVADVLLYTMALGLEFAALLALRRREPALRGAFRIPAGWWTVLGLALLPMLVLLLAVGLELHDGDYGAPGVVGALAAAALGPVVYGLAARRAAAAARSG